MRSMNTIDELLSGQARLRPEAMAIVSPEGVRWTYADLSRFAAETHARLRHAGLAPTDRVAVVAPNGALQAAIVLGVSASSVCIPLNPKTTPTELSQYLRQARARAVIVDEARAGEVTQIAASLGLGLLTARLASGGEPRTSVLQTAAPVPIPTGDRSSAGDLALLLQTSGTTSAAKFVTYPHRQLLRFASDIAQRLALTPDDRCLNVMPFYHSHGLFVALLASLAAGASVIATRGLFFVPDFFQWLVSLHPTWYTAVPTVHEAILERAEGFRSQIERAPLRLIRSASSSLAGETMKRLESTFGAPVIETYGLTEVVGWIANTPLPPLRRKPGSVGLGRSEGNTILGDDDRPVPQGTVGEIAVDRDRLVGYDGDAHREARFSGQWFRTGDMGYEDAQGYYFITGRVKEMINRGGEKISPREIDEVLRRHPEVKEALAFSIPSVSLGEEVGVAIVRQEAAELSEQAIREFAVQHLPAYKLPKKILFVEALPKGHTGKYDRLGMARLLGLA